MSKPSPKEIQAVLDDATAALAQMASATLDWTEATQTTVAEEMHQVACVLLGLRSLILEIAPDDRLAEAKTLLITLRGEIVTHCPSDERRDRVVAKVDEFLGRGVTQ